LHHAHVLPLACRALVDEMEWAISQIDPKKMIQTGSFRINPDGSQSVREVTYLSFIMASLCLFLTPASRSSCICFNVLRFPFPALKVICWN